MCPEIAVRGSKHFRTMQDFHHIPTKNGVGENLVTIMASTPASVADAHLDALSWLYNSVTMTPIIRGSVYAFYAL